MGNSVVRINQCSVENGELSRPVKVLRGKLPIFFCKGWGVWCLLDTGSNNTVVSEEVVKKVCPDTKISLCNCQVVTITGVKPLEGEITLPLKKLTGIDEFVRAHVADLASSDYDAIIGCDALELVAGCPKMEKGEWRIKLGKKKYRVGKTAKLKKHVLVSNVNVQETGGQMKAEREMLERNSDVIYKTGKKLTATGRVRHRISLEGDRPVYIKPRRYPHALKEVIKEQIEELLEQGIIRPSKSPYNSPVWVVPKAPGEDGKPRFRMVIDYRELNRRTLDEKYPLPRIEDILDRMHGAQVFSVIDLKSGYHQIKMFEEDIPKTAFSFERGHYEFVRMPFGLKNAPITFQHLMDEVLEGLDETYCQIYMDDMIVFSRTVIEHKGHLDRLLGRLRDFGLKISTEKSHLFKEEVKFMGHVINKEGVRPNRDKTEAVRNSPVPRTVKELRGLIGAVNYYRRFIPNMANIIKPLTKLLSKGARFEITPEVEAAINECKKILCSDQILRFPDFTKQFRVTTDASQVALGAVLSQIHGDDDMPIAFASKQLNPAETRYSAIERELLGIVWAVEYFRPYLYGRKFLILTDHKPLVWTDKLKETSARISRWKERLAPYNWEIQHKKGVENVVADWLSRIIRVNTGNIGEREEAESFSVRYLRDWAEGGPDLPVAESRGGEQQDRGESSTEVRGIEQAGYVEGIINDKLHQIIVRVGKKGGGVRSNHSKYGKLSITEIHLETITPDEEVIRVLREIMIPKKTYHIFVGNTGLKRRIESVIEGRHLVGGENKLVFCNRMVETVTDLTEQDEIVRNYHTGKTNHRGVTETLHRLQRTYYWTNMEQTVRRIIGECETCKIVKYDRRPHQSEQMITDTPTRPLETLHCDLFHFDKEKFVTLIDKFSKHAFVKKLDRKTADETLGAILTYMGLFGTPKTIVTDNGREFDNSHFRNTMKKLDVSTHFTTVGHSRSQGVIERLHNTLTEHINLIRKEQGLETKQAMTRAVLAYNHSIHTATGYSPIEIVFGENRGFIRTEMNSKIDRYVRQKKGNLEKISKVVRDRLEREKERRANRVNVRADNVMEGVSVGDIVYRKNFYKRRKGDFRYTGPYKVEKILDRNKIMLSSTTRPGKKLVTHINEVKSYKTINVQKKKK